MTSLYKLILTTSLAGILAITANPAVYARKQPENNTITTGYSALRLFLDDEQYLTTIRRTKMVITFSGISDTSAKLIDDINDTSEQAFDELEKLCTEKPSFAFEEFSEESIAKATFDSLRMTTAKEFFFESENFEKNLLLSQLNVLPVIIHLARQLEEEETSTKRKAWLNKLTKRYEAFYQKIKKRIVISKNK